MEVSDYMNWQEYLEMIRESAEEVCGSYGLPFACCVAQGAVESTWGQDGIGNGGFNIFGRKWGGTGEYVWCKTQEDDGTGNLYTIDAKFQSYDNMKEAVDDWCQLVTWRSEDGSTDYKQYSDQYRDDGDLKAFVYGICGIYATDIRYANKVWAIINDPDCELL